GRCPPTPAAPFSSGHSDAPDAAAFSRNRLKTGVRIVFRLEVQCGISTVRQEAEMQQRLDALKASPGAYKAMAGLQAYVDQTGLEKSLLELVKIRSSQINGCAFCLVMHTNDARKQ